MSLQFYGTLVPTLLLTTILEEIESCTARGLSNSCNRYSHKCQSASITGHESGLVQLMPIVVMLLPIIVIGLFISYKYKTCTKVGNTESISCINSKYDEISEDKALNDFNACVTIVGIPPDHPCLEG